MGTPKPAQTRIKMTPASRGREWKLERHEQILQAAFEQFAAKGYADTRIDDVARSAGIAKGTIYLYFKDKKRLFRAVLRSMTHHFFEELEPFVKTFQGSATELVGRIVERQYSELVKNPKARSMFRLLIAEGHRFPELSEVYFHEVIEPGVAAMQTILEKGIAAGEFRQTKLADFPQIFAGPAVLAVIWTLILGDRRPLDFDAYMDAHIELLLNGLKSTKDRIPCPSENALVEGEIP